MLKSIFHTVWTVGAVLLISGCDQAPKAAVSHTKDGHVLFDQYCAACHQDDGRGVFLKGIPANKHTQLSVAEIARLITVGHEGMETMPVFTQLNQQQAYAIASYVKKLDH
ncbi:cytochrome c [Maribrevibacterium harenarium]|uniref:Cytochrome c n=1 Tax=Maribrevibacterium harenarium TaxID=2589817 RepID=A0A501WGN5_9GAMM|nr:cytochrome c [Maribrevibacterium harenarium]